MTLLTTTQTTLANATNHNVLDHFELAVECAEIEHGQDAVGALRLAAEKAHQSVEVLEKVKCRAVTLKDGRKMLDKLDTDMKALYTQALRNAGVREMLAGYGMDVAALVAYHEIDEPCAGCGNTFDLCICGELGYYNAQEGGVELANAMP